MKKGVSLGFQQPCRKRLLYTVTFLSFSKLPRGGGASHLKSCLDFGIESCLLVVEAVVSMKSSTHIVIWTVLVPLVSHGKFTAVVDSAGFRDPAHLGVV